MLDSEQSLTIEELADRTGTPVRTIRFYIAEGLLPELRPNILLRLGGGSEQDEGCSRESGNASQVD